MIRRWLSGLVKDRRKPSEYLRRHLDGTGDGYELDDLASLHAGELGWEDVIKRLVEINKRHSQAGEAPLGIYKNEARGDLRTLAEELEGQGR